MNIMNTPKNQKQLVIYYLLKWESMTLKRVINHSMFFKFQTRLSEIEAKHGTIAFRDKVKFINQFGHKSNYNLYSKSINEEKLMEIYKTY